MHSIRETMGTVRPLLAWNGPFCRNVNRRVLEGCARYVYL
jgi:hypothetical protein